MDARFPGNGLVRRWKKSKIDSAPLALSTRESKARWRHQGILYRDNLSRLIVDVPDKPQNRKWMKSFKERLKIKFDQLELWMISYPIEFD